MRNIPDFCFSVDELRTLGRKEILGAFGLEETGHCGDCGDCSKCFPKRVVIDSRPAEHAALRCNQQEDEQVSRLEARLEKREATSNQRRRR